MVLLAKGKENAFHIIMLVEYNDNRKKRIFIEGYTDGGMDMNFRTISPREIEYYKAHFDVVVIDLREETEYLKGHIPNAINIPYEKIEENKLCLRQDKFLIVYCERGNTSLQLARQLSGDGYSIATVYGGIHAYRGTLVKGK